ncbi:PspA/IM30 family protein [Methanotrichaceae archaeon M04Ac]|uniref:PspA/IM30 family protein n=1 Tax=Candidatus Methanocrinis alkalitolerans TaxID=3033395 RepID=A0ABT5XI68_9EURY|nr:PspA/IM30 family protein [Candidatus Methanocrinis alkalitolerans]MCR3884370.1 PspA/IM30 family protein [Methanothrix sp.]MDF0594328.1 PspA/IM30 family protein [Candidatus Methanocrinis alkalitolerans]
MGLLNRMSTVVKAKMNTIMDRVEDPNETLDYSYQKQLELLQNVKRGVAEVATSKKRLELQRAKLAMKIDQLDSQAREAIKGDREDLARQALVRKSALTVQIEGLDREIADLAREQEKLEATDRRLTAKVESFRAKKETIKAQYSAAEAQVKVTESLTGISEEMADVGLAVQRSEDKIETMRARSAALDELVERGTLEEFAGGDEVERELARIKAKSSVEDDLARLKAEEGR